MNKSSNQHWDIFCAVVDNYGDIGVTWRLAKQLHAEYGIEINLWVDDLHSFSHILPQLNPAIAQQCFCGVNIFQWNNPLDIEYKAGSVLIEAFACELPSQVKSSIEELHNHNKHHTSTSSHTPPLWINLEYLCAEDWVDGCHGLPSMQQSGLKKYFYFPGFTAKSGGLICEQDLFSQRNAWQADSSNKLSLFRQLGLSGINAEDVVVSVFSYESQSLASLVKLWRQSSQTMHALIPVGKSLTSIIDLLPVTIENIKPGQQYQLENLVIHILPMTDQSGFDRLLWSCDINIVRGEDSFLRAQWAARPFIWHIYPQDEDYHLVKLQAFVNIYTHKLDDRFANIFSEVNFAFNQQRADISDYWQQLISVQLPMQRHATDWAVDAKNDADLATRLVQFIKTS
ncbi:elongation factor P maturation arginine rhamnosyltransferase EarP [Shewanella sp. 3_MG-2023]|uniref:elongation factor P maturation arginine rhamnosyltransferase EarP n=1 Tax=Shewanella sp. 3_MG-2023 TaxID=3062635 RepID=UPI0026E42800|nr:elongation factor P maturation arginine rhamnosyltransferase EarP [Shewanella sp. 3_MG-2023]MDO6776427.1 elongation factor P maturation arginine rhamnosyltransferase EarP [Shewanella sp. 3_MG-2023]